VGKVRRHPGVAATVLLFVVVVVAVATMPDTRSPTSQSAHPTPPPDVSSESVGGPDVNRARPPVSNAAGREPLPVAGPPTDSSRELSTAEDSGGSLPGAPPSGGAVEESSRESGPKPAQLHPGAPGGLGGSTSSTEPPAARVRVDGRNIKPSHMTKDVRPIRVGGSIKPPTKTRDVPPTYPAIAQSSRVQGIVIIEATIGPNGKVTDAKVLRSIPLLDQAALEAVRQWEFTPTVLNGVPVPVLMTVTVAFTLQ
jgi:TonB family protein